MRGSTARSCRPTTGKRRKRRSSSTTARTPATGSASFVRTDPRPGDYPHRRGGRLPVGQQCLSGRQGGDRRADQQLVGRRLQPHRARDRRRSSCRRRARRTPWRPPRRRARAASTTSCAPGKLDRSQLTPNANFYFTPQAIADYASSLGPLGQPSAFEPKGSPVLRGGFVIQNYVVKYPGRTLEPVDLLRARRQRPHRAVPGDAGRNERANDRLRRSCWSRTAARTRARSTSSTRRASPSGSSGGRRRTARCSRPTASTARQHSHSSCCRAAAISKWSARSRTPAHCRPGASPNWPKACPKARYRLADGEPGPAALGWLLAQHRFDDYRSKADEAGARPAGARHRRCRHDRADGAPRRSDGAGPRPRQHAGRRARARPSSSKPRARKPPRRRPAPGHERRRARGRLSADRRGRRRGDAGARAAADRARMGQARATRASRSSARACASTAAGSTSSRPAGMRLMKKDMGGAAHALALARLIMAERLPVRLHLLIPAVENAVSGARLSPRRHRQVAQGTVRRDRQHRCRRAPDPRRRADQGGGRRARADRRFRDADRRRARRARPRPAGVLRQRRRACRRRRSGRARGRGPAVADAAVGALRRHAQERRRRFRQCCEQRRWRAASPQLCS